MTETEKQLVRILHTTPKEAEKAARLWRIMEPGLKIKKGKVATSYGDKTPFEFYLLVKEIVNGINVSRNLRRVF